MILLKLVASRTSKSSVPVAGHHATCPLSPTLFFSHPWPFFLRHLFFRFSLLRKIRLYRPCVCLCQSVCRRTNAFSRSWYVPSLSENEADLYVWHLKAPFVVLVKHPIPDYYGSEPRPSFLVTEVEQLATIYLFVVYVKSLTKFS